MTFLPDEQYNELAFYTLAHPDPNFIHQHIVDAFTAQNADEQTKPIGMVFSLAGLYLYIEKGFTGRQVQQAHMKMAKHKNNLPSIQLPAERGNITISDVLMAPAGGERDHMIYKWCEAVWSAFQNNRDVIISLTQSIIQ